MSRARLITPAVWAEVLRQLMHELALDERRRAAREIQPYCDLLIATHPDLVELDLWLDLVYDV